MSEPGDGYHERLHADVHRAVGGSLNLIRELSRISYHLDHSLSAEWMIKRIQFFAYELQSRLETELRESCGAEFYSPRFERERLQVLNEFFFVEKNFRCLSDFSELHHPSAALTMNHVLMNRAGTPTVLALIYAFLAERVNVSLEFVDLKPICFLKWCDQGRSRFIDIARGGTHLASDELIDVLHHRFRMTSFSSTSLLETYSFESFISDYITELKKTFLPDAEPELLLYLQNTLVSYQPSNLALLAERAALHRKLGNFKSALADLKRFFAFFEREKAPAELLTLHDELVQLLEKKKTNIEVID